LNPPFFIQTEKVFFTGFLVYNIFLYQLKMKNGILHLKDPKTGRIFPLQPLPPFLLKIFRAGGIVPFLRKGNLEDLY